MKETNFETQTSFYLISFIINHNLQIQKYNKYIIKVFG